MTILETRDTIAAVRHDVKTGNLERARKHAATVLEGDWSQASPDQLEHACLAVEVKLEEANVR